MLGHGTTLTSKLRQTADLPRGGSTNRNGMRRYVIDETVGSVDVLDAFDSLGNMPDSHEIRLEDGKVKYVHTVTVIVSFNPSI